MSDQGRAYLYACLSIFFWSTIPSAFKIGLQHLSPVQFLFIATWTSFFNLLFINVFQGNLGLIRAMRRRSLLQGALMGLLNPFLYYLILLKAYELLPGQIAQPLNMVWPIVLVIFSVLLLGQKIRASSFLALLVSFCGVYLISSQGSPWEFRFKEPLGVVLALSSAVLWALYFILQMKRKGKAEINLLTAFGFASVYISLLLLSRPDGFEGFTWRGGFWGVYAGFFEMGLSFVLWIKALQLTRTTDQISNLVYIAPFISLVFLHIFVGETIFVTSVIGLTFIVLGIFTEKMRLF